MTTEKTYILVEITHKGPLKKTVAQDMPRRLSQVAFDLVQARGADCLDATAKQVDPDELVAAEREACAKICDQEIFYATKIDDASSSVAAGVAAGNCAVAIRARSRT